MITKPISIPINLLGPGSQPERSVANTIGVPDIVDTFRQPYTPEVADKETAEKCRQFFIDLYEEMRLWNMDSGDAGPAFAMNGYDKETLALINQMLGEGEVAIRISIPNETFDEIRIQESIFVGVWRVCYYRDGQQIADQLEVSAIPSCDRSCSRRGRRSNDVPRIRKLPYFFDRCTSRLEGSVFEQRSGSPDDSQYACCRRSSGRSGCRFRRLGRFCRSHQRIDRMGHQELGTFTCGNQIMPGFEGTFLGDSSKLHPDTRLECKVCHYIYDPSKGDVDQNIEPGTPFSELPEYWNCPVCGCERDLFMVVPEDYDQNQRSDDSKSSK